MPTTILRKKSLIPGRASKLAPSAPQIVATAKSGHFVMLRVDEQGERFPLTIADTDSEKETIIIVYLVVGKSTMLLKTLSKGDGILDVAGPLGKATYIVRSDSVTCVGGSTDIAAVHYIAKGHHKAGNYVITIIGVRSKDLLLFENELKSFRDEVLISTGDGSYRYKGSVTDLLKDRLERNKKVQEVVAVGPVPIMQAVMGTTLPFGVTTTINLNSFMAGGVGIYGACHVTVDGETKFTCAGDPEFDEHKVDFARLRQCLSAFRSREKQSIEHRERRYSCHDKH